jgi:hypothetical protein
VDNLAHTLTGAATVTLDASLRVVAVRSGS